MKLSLGCDHGAYALKEHLKDYLTGQGHEVVDCGTYSTDSCDYPIFARAAAEQVASGQCERGIVLCTTGIGVSMVANKVKGVRCALVPGFAVRSAHPPAQQRQYASPGRRLYRQF